MSKQAWTKILTNVLRHKEDGSLNLVLLENGYITLSDIVGMSFSELERPQSLKQLCIGHRGLLRAFKAYVLFLQKTSGHVHFSEMTTKDFDRFRISLDYNPDVPFHRTQMPSVVITEFGELRTSQAPQEDYKAKHLCSKSVPSHSHTSSAQPTTVASSFPMAADLCLPPALVSTPSSMVPSTFAIRKCFLRL